MNPGCDEILSSVAGFPHGTPLSLEATNALRAHIESCEQCREKFSKVVAVGICLMAATPEEATMEISDAEVEARVRAGVAAANAQGIDRPVRIRPVERGWSRAQKVFAMLGVTAAAACLALVFWLSDRSDRQLAISGMQVLYQPGRGTLGDPRDGFQVQLGLKRSAYVIIAARNELGVIEEIQGESQEHVAIQMEGTSAIPPSGAYALRDLEGSLRTHVLILACEHPISDEDWFSRSKQVVANGEGLESRLERTCEELAERFQCDVRLAPIPSGP